MKLLLIPILLLSLPGGKSALGALATEQQRDNEHWRRQFSSEPSSRPEKSGINTASRGYAFPDASKYAPGRLDPYAARHDGTIGPKFNHSVRSRAGVKTIKPRRAPSETWSVGQSRKKYNALTPINGREFLTEAEPLSHSDKENKDV